MLFNSQGSKRTTNKIVTPNLIWENTDDISSALYSWGPQTITFDDYSDAYLIELAWSGGHNLGYTAIHYVNANDNGDNLAVNRGQTSVVSREITSVTPTEIVFGRGYVDTDINNARAIPLRIWGVKFTL